MGTRNSGAVRLASKAFTKALCDEANIPTARYRRFDALDPALAYSNAQLLPVVVKADGLAAGKGVTVAATHAEAEAALRDLFASLGVPPWQREAVPLLVDPHGQLVALGDLAYAPGFDAWLRERGARLLWQGAQAHG